MNNFFKKCYNSYVQELEDLEEQNKNKFLDIKILALDIQDTFLKETKNFVIIILIVLSN